MNFDWKSAIAQRPSGASRAALIAAYGDPAAGSTRTSGGWFTPNPAFAAQLVMVPTSELPSFPISAYTGKVPQHIQLHRIVAPIFVATWGELARRDLTRHLYTFDGSTAFRHMLNNYANPVSLHAYGTALDFNAKDNGYGIPASRMKMHPDVVRCFEECGWESGTRWNPTDGMHFQWTDPLPNVPQASWRDAMSLSAGPTPATPPQPQRPVFLIPDGKGGWEHIEGKKVEGRTFTVINALDPYKIYAR